MTRLLTETPEVQLQDMNILLGSFQRSEGSVLGSISDGLSAGIRTHDRAAANLAQTMGIDEALAADLVNSSEARQLERTLQKGQARADQTGSTSNLQDLSTMAAVRRAQARGVPMEVINSTVRDTTGSSTFDIIQEEIKKQGPTPREGYTKFLEEEDELFTSEGTSIYDLNDAELESFAFEKNLERDQLRDAERTLNSMQTDEQTTNLGFKQHIRGEVLPTRLGIMHDRVKSFIQRSGFLYQTQEEDGLGVGQALNISEIPGEELTGMKIKLQALKDGAMRDIRNRMSLRGMGKEIEEVTSLYDLYFQEAERFLRGETTLEALNDIHAVREAVSKDQFYASNPLAVDAITASQEMGRIVTNLGLENWDTAENFANTVLAPLVKGVTVNAASHFSLAGLSPAEQKDVVFTLSDYLRDPKNDLRTKGKALSSLLDNFTLGAVDRADLFDSMLQMLADPEGAATVLSAADGVTDTRVRQQIQQGLLNYKEEFQQQFTNELAQSLRKGFVQGRRPPPGFGASTEEQLDFFNNPGKMRTLNDFISDNLFVEGETLNFQNLEDLSEKERELVTDLYNDMLDTDVGRKLEFMEQINTNLLKQKFRPLFENVPLQTAQEDE